MTVRLTAEPEPVAVRGPSIARPARRRRDRARDGALRRRGAGPDADRRALGRVRARGPVDRRERRHRAATSPRCSRTRAPVSPRLFGAWRAGCTVASLPLPARGMAPQVYVEQLARFCAAAGAQALMLDPAHTPLLDGCAATRDAHLRRGALGRCTGSRRVPSGALVQFTSGSVGTPKGIYLTLDAVGAHVVAILAALRARRRRRLVLVAAVVARHGPDRPAAVAAGRRRSPIRSSPPHAHEARDVHGQPAVVAAHVLGRRARRSPSRRTSRWSSRSARAAASGRSTSRRLRVGHRRVGVGARRHARAVRRGVRAAGLPAARVLPGVRHGGSDARGHDRAARTSRGGRSAPADDAGAGDVARPIVSTGFPIDGVDVRVDRARRRGRPDRVPQPVHALALHRSRAAAHRRRLLRDRRHRRDGPRRVVRDRAAATR